jgi:hypothetical protein
MSEADIASLNSAVDELLAQARKMGYVKKNPPKRVSLQGGRLPSGNLMQEP